MKSLKTLNEELAYTLGGFNRYMNRPLAKVQVFTWRTANDMQENCPTIRLLRPYRDETNKAFRIKLARAIKQVRKHFKIILPCYDESRAEYTRETLTNRRPAAVTAFRNTNYTKRNYECTNVIACQAESRPGSNWVECDESILEGLSQLWIEGGVRYFGHL